MIDYPAPTPKTHVYLCNLAAFIKLPSNPAADITYKDLPCTEHEKAYIIEIVTSIAELSKFSLLLKQEHMRFIGAQVNHVHPLKFLSIALGTPYLKSCFIVIFDDFFKRNGFMDGLGPTLSREADKGKIDAYLVPFAEEMGVDPEQLKPFARERDWEGFVRFLMNS